MIREPAAAGSFYPKDPKLLGDLVSKQMKDAKLPKSFSGAVAFVAPHAGYQYSGPIAAFTYAALSEAYKKKKFGSLIIVGPNHTGYGEPISISLSDWRTPLGIVENDIELSRVISEAPDMSGDEIAHMHEHSVEVQLPFIQGALGAVRCVFICMGDQSYGASVALSDAILQACRIKKMGAAVIASSDFNHYESAEVAKRKDMPAIEAIKKLDARTFHDQINRNDDSACGYGPITVASLFAKKAGATSGTLVKYGSSGDATGDYSSVVAYASIVFE